MKPLNPPVLCRDFVKLSIQASEFHYCSPRLDSGPYSAVEVGFVEDKEGNRIVMPDAWAEYADNSANPLQSDVYGYVPVSLVKEFIAAHGGNVTGMPF